MARGMTTDFSHATMLTNTVVQPYYRLNTKSVKKGFPEELVRNLTEITSPVFALECGDLAPLSQRAERPGLSQSGAKAPHSKECQIGNWQCSN